MDKAVETLVESLKKRAQDLGRTPAQHARKVRAYAKRFNNLDANLEAAVAVILKGG